MNLMTKKLKMTIGILGIVSVYMALPAYAGPIPVTGDGIVVQDQLAHVDKVVFSGATATFTQLYPTPTTDYSFELNNMGYRPSDGQLYALKLTGSGLGGSANNLIRIGDDGVAVDLGVPSGLPSGTTGTRFAAGDVGLSNDKEVLYASFPWVDNIPDTQTPQAGKLFTIDLTDPSYTTSVLAITGSAGSVFDWAYDPESGNLYGGDSTHGQLAILNPTTGVRTDVSVTGLLSGVAYGAAWRGASGTIFLYRNSGTGNNIFEIDLNATSGPAIIGQWDGPDVTYNDGASLIPEPATLSLLVLGCMGWTIRRRKA